MRATDAPPDGVAFMARLLRESVAEGVRAAQSTAAQPTIVVNNNAGGGGEARQRRREVGSKFARCEHCKEAVLYAVNPEVCARPYLVCSRDCTAERPKALHCDCALQVARDENNSGQILEAACPTCNHSVEVDCTENNAHLVVNLLTSRTTYALLVLALLFVLSGYVWKAWAFYYIVNRWEPIDALNNPSLVFLNRSTHREELRAPTWAHDFLAYNHCILTDYGRRTIMARTAMHTGRADKKRKGFTIQEELAAFYALLNDMTTDEDEPDVTKYFSPCSRAGFLTPNMGHLALCVHFLRWPLVGLVVLFVLYRADRFLFDGRMALNLRRSRMAGVIRIGGKVYRPPNQSERAARLRRVSFGLARQ